MSDPFEERITTGLMSAGVATPKESGASTAVIDLVLSLKWPLDINRTIELCGWLQSWYPNRDMRYLTTWVRPHFTGSPSADEILHAISRLGTVASLIAPGNVMTLSSYVYLAVGAGDISDRVHALGNVIRQAIHAADPAGRRPDPADGA